MRKLLFFTYADKNYEFFAIPYVWFALSNNKDSFVEITLDCVESFNQKNKFQIDILNERFPGQFAFSQSTHAGKGIIPNTVRFLDVPTVECQYVYIGDIDLLVFDDVLSVHLKLIRDNGIAFSNIVREVNDVKPRLTGLHFCKFSDYYPAPDLSDIDLRTENDEHVLYLYMTRKGFKIDPNFRQRPSCGIHLSLNRDPQGRYTGDNSSDFKVGRTLGWGGKLYYDKLLEQLKDLLYIKLERLMDFKFRCIMFSLESIAGGNEGLLHWFALSNFVDKRFFTQYENISLSEFNILRDSLIKRKLFLDAEALTKQAAVIWPNNLDVLRKLVWILFCNKKIEQAVIVLSRMIKIPNGLELIVKVGIVSKNRNVIESSGPEGHSFIKLFDQLVN